ncbi:mobile mystery protein A [Parapedobacter sp. SGR-10]|uniref:mobile mystery protein A n=1 Tax=Parapedobacter sp. SGR-10 TaxID=2710879 RepID=UPI0013D476E6|nr:mobile mystery protein A [Parapedobacter sp. SGR-10]NGF57869.1 mobile mystery protein A [Parapedobacter sp. SGR-10]
MAKKKLQVQHLSDKMQALAPIKNIAVPPNGWIRAIRTALGMSMQQLGDKLAITKQSVQDLERREQQGSLTLKSLRQAAKALDMDLVYGFVPKDGTLELMIERKAKELAKEIVLRTSNTMKLENQKNSDYRIEKAIEERAIDLAREMPKILWD